MNYVTEDRTSSCHLVGSISSFYRPFFSCKLGRESALLVLDIRCGCLAHLAFSLLRARGSGDASRSRGRASAGNLRPWLSSTGTLAMPCLPARMPCKRRPRVCAMPARFWISLARDTLRGQVSSDNRRPRHIIKE
jgi:hypothetical protein